MTDQNVPLPAETPATANGTPTSNIKVKAGVLFAKALH